MVALCVASGPLEALIPDMHDGDSHDTSMTSTHEPSPLDSGSGPVHAVHVDHCSHGHLVALSSPSALPTDAMIFGERKASADVELNSIEFAPRLRPPIA